MYLLLETFFMSTKPSKELDVFDNPNPDRDSLYLDYIPDQLCVELKALKLYIWSYRDEGAFHEAVTNAILDDLVAATSPRYLRLCARFYVRGGIYTTVTAQYSKPDWQGTIPSEPQFND